MRFREMPPSVGDGEKSEEELDDDSMEETTSRAEAEVKNPEEVGGATEEQRQEEAEKIQDNFRKYAKTRREIAESFNEAEKAEYKKAYDRMTEEMKDRVSEISSSLEEENFDGVREKSEEAEQEVKKSMGKGKEWLGAGVDFVKVEIIPFLDKIISEETLETAENTVKTLKKKAEILKDLVSCLEDMGGSSQEIVVNCKEALSVLKKMRGLEGGEKTYQDEWGVENKRILKETVIKNGGEYVEEEYE